MFVHTGYVNKILKALGLRTWRTWDILNAIEALKALATAEPEPEPGSLDWALAQPEGTKFTQEGRTFTLRRGSLQEEGHTDSPYAVIDVGWLTGWEIIKSETTVYTRKQASPSPHLRVRE